MPGAGLAGVTFLLLAVAAPLVLYVLVRRERENTQTMDRTDAERTARRDTKDE